MLGYVCIGMYMYERCGSSISLQLLINEQTDDGMDVQVYDPMLVISVRTEQQPAAI